RTGGQALVVLAHDLRGPVGGALEVVQRADLQQRDGLVEVEVGAHRLVVEHLGGVEDVGRDERRVLVLLEQRPAVGHHDRVVVHVDDRGVGVDALHDLVRVLGRGQSGAAVEELRDPRLLGDEPAGPDEEVAVLVGEVPGGRGLGEDAVAHLAVDLVVVLAAEERVVDPRDARPRRIHTHRHAFGLGYRSGGCGRHDGDLTAAGDGWTAHSVVTYARRSKRYVVGRGGTRPRARGRPDLDRPPGCAYVECPDDSAALR